MEGFGKMTLADEQAVWLFFETYFKQEYSGSWSNNLMEGEGVYTWKNGIEFRGFYKNDLKHGKGVYKVPN